VIARILPAIFSVNDPYAFVLSKDLPETTVRQTLGRQGFAKLPIGSHGGVFRALSPERCERTVHICYISTKEQFSSSDWLISLLSAAKTEGKQVWPTEKTLMLSNTAAQHAGCCVTNTPPPRPRISN